jgi:hypothetical protein
MSIKGIDFTKKVQNLLKQYEQHKTIMASMNLKI